MRIAASISYRWMMRGRSAPPPTSSFVIRSDEDEVKKLSRAALEVPCDHSLSPAGDARRNRGYPRRPDLPRHAGCADGGGLGSFSWSQAHPGPAGNARDNARFP